VLQGPSNSLEETCGIPSSSAVTARRGSMFRDQGLRSGAKPRRGTLDTPLRSVTEQLTYQSPCLKRKGLGWANRIVGVRRKSRCPKTDIETNVLKKSLHVCLPGDFYCKGLPASSKSRFVMEQTNEVRKTRQCGSTSGCRMSEDRRSHNCQAEGGGKKRERERRPVIPGEANRRLRLRV
jgi:hypothetical protein